MNVVVPVYNLLLLLARREMLREIKYQMSSIKKGHDYIIADFKELTE